MDSDSAVRSQVVALLRGGNAHMPFDEAVADFPMDSINTVIPNGSYTPWHILEHLRFTQWDILEFMVNPRYHEPKWPVEYWPSPEATATPEQWRQTIDAFRADLARLVHMAEDPSIDLHAPIPWGDGQTPLREYLVVADHNAYHVGEFAILRQVMGTWPPGHQ